MNKMKEHGALNSAIGIGRVNSAFACGGLSPSQKSVLVYLALRHNEQKRHSWVSVGEIAHSCALSIATVKRVFKVFTSDKNGEPLVTRKLRDERVTKSRSTTINWTLLEERRTAYRPPLPAVSSQVSAADVAVIESFSEPQERDAVRDAHFEEAGFRDASKRCRKMGNAGDWAA